MLSAAPGQPKGKKKHHDTIRDLMLASSHVLSSISRGGTQWVYGGRLFVASARTNKMHHRKLGAIFAANFDFFSENSFSPP